MPKVDACQGRPTWLEIELAAVHHNFQVVRRKVGPGVGIFPVIKADGYGLGALPMARRLEEAGANGYCVALVEEARCLRREGVCLPIVLLSGLYEGLERDVVALQLQPFVFDMASLIALSRAAGSETVSVFLKVDTGMGRLGFAPKEVAAAVAQIKALPGLALAGMVSHLACADQPDHPANDEQCLCFREVLQQQHPLPPPHSNRTGTTGTTGMMSGRASLANSAALLSRPETHFSWVRPGIMLYGASPFFPANAGRDVGLRSVVRWCTRILQVQNVSAGTAIGYSQTFITRKPARIALLPVGYADGYNRLLSNRAVVLLAGRRVPVVGRVSMDLIAIDSTALPSAGVGHLVTLLGQDGSERIDVEDMASWRQTIPYEVLCDLGRRLPRRYV